MSEQYNPNEAQDAEAVTPLGVVKVVVVLFIGLGALLAVLAVFGIFAWLSLWNLMLKLAAAGAILIAVIFLIGWLMQGKK